MVYARRISSLEISKRQCTSLVMQTSDTTNGKSVLHVDICRREKQGRRFSARRIAGGLVAGRSYKRMTIFKATQLWIARTFSIGTIEGNTQDSAWFFNRQSLLRCLRRKKIPVFPAVLHIIAMVNQIASFSYQVGKCKSPEFI